MRKFIPFILTIPLFFVSCGGDTEKEISDNSEEETVVTDSLSYYEMKLKANPNNPKVKFERAKYFVRQGDVDLAIIDLQDILSEDSTHLGANKLYADISLAMLDLESAKFHYEYVLGRDSTNAEVMLGLARIYAAIDNYAKADYYISESLRNDPYSADPYFTRGLIYRSDYYATGRKSSWDIAMSSFQTAIEQEPDYYEAFVELGVMYAEKGDSIAIEYYNSALDIFPESIEAWYNKGYFYQSTGYFNDASYCYYKLIDIDSSWFKPYYNLGYLNMLVYDDMDSAVYYFEKCTYWDPDNYAAYNNLGLTYEKMGDLNNARKYYQKAVEINPDFQLAKDNLAALGI